MEASPILAPPNQILEDLMPSYQSIVDTVKESWQLWHQTHSALRQSLLYYRPKNRAIGSDMSDILRATFKEKSEGNLLPNIKFIEQDKLWLIIINSTYAIRFNMMNEQGMTVRTHTEQSKKYRDGQLEIEDFEGLDLLYGGYILDQSKSEIVNVYILKRNENEIPLWVVDQSHNVFTQPEIEFNNPARIVKLNPDIEKARPKRALVKKKLDKDTQPGEQKTGTDNA